MNNLMRILVCISASILFGYCTIQAQYYGGQGDGAQKSSTIQITLNGNQINTLVLYRGGQSDGHNKKTIVVTLAGKELASLYKGGYNDGSTKDDFQGTLTGTNLAGLYLGGIGDGNHKSYFQGVLDGTPIEILYLGGIGDGNHKNSFSGILNGEELAQLYEGGIGDGNHKSSFSGILNGEELAQLYEGGIGDGADKDDFSGILDGSSLAGLYSGGSGDGFSKHMIQYTFDFPGCTFVVNTDDDGFGSLRYAIDCAAPGDTIEFSSLLLNDSIQLALGSGPLTISKDLYINANPSSNLTVDGSFLVNSFLTGANGLNNITIKGLNILAGTAQIGGAIMNEAILTLEELDIIDSSNNSVTLIASFNGGSLSIKGTVQLLDN
jgi:hypothetical protein